MTADTDIAIIGGGPVGAALALALYDSPLRVTVLEARIPHGENAMRDPRPIALSHGSRLLLERLGAWRGLSPAPIQHIHVSQRGGFGRVALGARDSGVPSLGYVVDYSKVFTALSHAARVAGSDYREGARVSAIHRDSDGCRIDCTIDGTTSALHARLAVVADGGDIDGLAPAKVLDYAQCALTARVRTTQPHRDTAYERFTTDGPLALLPFGAQMALVWTLTPERSQLLAQMAEPEFLAALRDAFGGRLGEFTEVTQRACYPLALRYAADTVQPCVITIGNAAQTLHPVAGQGFNLGLRDAWELGRMLRTTSAEALASPENLRRFRRARRLDRLATAGATHALVSLFSNDFFGLGPIRGAGMTLVGCVPPVRDFLARRMIFGAHG